MLDLYCNSLSDEAQLKIATRFTKNSLQIWTTYFEKNPSAMAQVNSLVAEKNRIAGGGPVDIGFPARALEKIERSLVDAQQRRSEPTIPAMKSDATLYPLLATCMQPLTNAEWDNTLTQSVRLVFTSVFNILAWLLLRRMTVNNETHIYVAINQAIDALTRESLMTFEEANLVLSEYKHEVRGAGEDDAWENARGIGRQEGYSREDLLAKIAGENVNKDQCGRILAKEVVRQMKEEGKSYSNSMDEYLSGTCTTYGYNKDSNSFYRNETDVIVGSFSNDIPMSESDMLYVAAQFSLTELRECGFEV